ncbi:SID1 transmembrane family member 1-like isoform X2 [Aricia agestis]|uniref:SID1 transmembrane family member 1-like isoform X2 n=1 Tax=Aricia agestis TaxID=91739 RepID=UPI001C20A63C|nr:SID1 transmembrane family member 1-like isoform X2 [Aricia agestis]
MISIIIIFVLTCAVHCFVNGALPANDTTKKTFVYNTYEYNSIINLTVNDVTTQVLDFTEDTDQWVGYPTRVHVQTDDDLNLDYPLFVTAAQQKGVSSWELPLVMKTHIAYEIGRTLCPHDAGPNTTVQSRPTLTLSTSSERNVSVSIKLRRVTDFYIEVNKEVTLNVTPATPKYYYFSFDRDPVNVTHVKNDLFPHFNYTIPKSVLLIIDSDDELCAEVSIQNNSCPVLDNEKDIGFQGYHFTMTTKGGITVTQSMFPKGFYVVFTVRETDEECSGSRGSGDRLKQFRVNVVAAVSYTEYLTGVLAALALMLLVGALGPVVSALSCRKTEEVTLLIEDAPGPSTSRPEAEFDENGGAKESDEESETSEGQELSLPRALTLAGLSRARPKAHDRRTNRYFWSALTVAVVYALPVVQLLFTYQQMIFKTGEQDVCYYNFLCALPLGPLSDFNHVFSNVGYVMLGAFFMLQVRARPRPDDSKELGIPQHRGVLYSMGLALMMEGVLSACYHLCPNQMNFQFDSSFMYVTAVLTIIKLYQSRHPDVNASAHATFLLLAFLMAIGFIGIMYPSVYFWAVFTVLHLIICIIFTLKIYYVGRINLECAVFGRAFRNIREQGVTAFKPAYHVRAILLAIANAANWALAIYGLYEHNKDFAKHLLAILMGNALLYTLAYVVLKLAYRERIPVSAWIWLASAHVTWAVAGYLFLAAKTKWSQTPAQSRTHNEVCSALRVFDSHDLWHLASAVAMFCSFNALLVLDEPLNTVPRRLIPVF